MRHHDHRWRVEAIDEAPRLFVDVQRIRTPDPLHPAAAEPLGRLAQQRLGDLRIVEGVEEAEEAGVVLVALEVEAIDLRRDAADRLTIPVRDPSRGLAVIEEGVLLGVDTIAHVHVEWADVAGVRLEDRVDDVQEIATDLPVAFERADLDAHDGGELVVAARGNKAHWRPRLNR